MDETPLPENPDGPPLYNVLALDRVLEWQIADHEEWVVTAVHYWMSGLYWDPWQEPSVQSSPPESTQDELRTAVIPGTRVGISYLIWPKSRTVRLIQLADLP